MADRGRVRRGDGHREELRRHRLLWDRCAVGNEPGDVDLDRLGRSGLALLDRAASVVETAPTPLLPLPPHQPLTTVPVLAIPLEPIVGDGRDGYVIDEDARMRGTATRARAAHSGRAIAITDDGPGVARDDLSLNETRAVFDQLRDVLAAQPDAATGPAAGRSRMAMRTLPNSPHFDVVVLNLVADHGRCGQGDWLLVAAQTSGPCCSAWRGPRDHGTDAAPRR